MGAFGWLGSVEFGGLNAVASKAPIDLLKSNAAKLFPEIKYERIDEWLGHRPTTANSLPLIGRVNKYNNVLTGFGHQHVGLDRRRKNWPYTCKSY
jgi:D-amino-acid dehydrogenase